MKKIVRLTESKLVELMREIVSEQQVNAGQKKGFDYELLNKKFADYVNTQYELEAAMKNFNDPKLEASLIAKVNRLKADYERMYKLQPVREIPKVTTTKFMPPEIKPDEEVTKPEPEPEPEEAVELNAYNQKILSSKKRGLITPEQFMDFYNRANPSRPIKTPNDKIIPYVTTNKFMPPAGSNEPELTKPEPPADDMPLDEQEVNVGNRIFKNAYSPEEVKRLEALNAYNSNLLDLKRKGKITPAQYMQKYNAANPKNKIKSPNELTIPYVTTTRFLPPEIKHDEEVTKPEPAPEPEEKPIYTEPELGPEELVEPPQLQESIKRIHRMFNRMK